MSLRGIAMNANFFLPLLAVAVSLISAEMDSSEESNSKMARTFADYNDSRGNIEPTTTENISKSTQTRQRRPNHSVPSDQRPPPHHKPHRAYVSHYLDDGAIPHLGFSSYPRQSVYLSDHTGDYDVRIQDFQHRQPTQFQAALGAISAHILNQNKNEEYVPYPPNGDPYNYPSYRGNPTAIEPSVVRAYERKTKANYEIQPPEDFNQPNPSRTFSFDGYQPSGSNYFQEPNYFNSPNFLSHRPPRPGLKAARPLYEYKWYEDDTQIN